MNSVARWIDDKPHALAGRAAPYVLLAVLAAAVYGTALWFPPTAGDDLRYLTSVAATSNPLIYFIGDHGHGNHLYRPLTSVSLWLAYRLFGVWAFPNQAINLLLHTCNAFLVYRILRRTQPDNTIAILCAALFLASRYSLLTAASTPDRPMALAGLFLLLLVDHLTASDAGNRAAAAPAIQLWRVAALSTLALLSKESGLVVPALGLLFVFSPWAKERLAPTQRARLGFVLAAIMAAYVGLRAVIFGADAASYGQDGYLFLGLGHYENVWDLPGALPYVAFTENALKNVIAPILPAFGEGGNLLTRGALLAYLPVIAPTALLFGLAVGPRLSRLQWIALLIVVANAVVHYTLFRYRLQYLSHAALCLFIGVGPRLTAGASWTPVFRGLAVLLLLASTLWVSHILAIYGADRVVALSTLPHSLDTLPPGIDRHVVERVLALYR